MASLRVKYSLGRLLALLLLVVLMPLLLAIAVSVWCSSRGPVLYRQRRVGERGREFMMLKFRSMHASSGGLEETPAASAGLAPGGLEAAERRTRVGSILRRTSLDELPQLVNVVRGEMCLVGPRPERPEHAARFSREVPGYADRQRVRAGITGLAQVQGSRGRTCTRGRPALDNSYIERRSLALDVAILARTARAVLQGAE